MTDGQTIAAGVSMAATWGADQPDGAHGRGSKQMSKVRVYELARELNVETKVLLSKLKGAKSLSHQSTLTDEQVGELRQAFGATVAAAAGSAAASQAAAAASDGGRPKVILRRRAPNAPGDDGAAPQEPAAAATPAVEPAVIATPAAVEPPKVAPPVVVEAPIAAPVVAPVAAPVVAAPVPPPPVQVARAPEAVEAPVAREEEERPAAAAARAVATEVPRAPAAVAAAPAPVPGDLPPRRREVPGGATIVRRATPEEVAAAERLRSQAGRKEDARGTRITGMGLLQNRVGGPAAGAPAGPNDPASPPPSEFDEWGNRRGGVGTKDRRQSEEEEQKAKKAAAKARRSNVALNMRALLAQVEDIEGAPGEEDPAAAAAAAQSAERARQAARTVYTPSASRNKRDIKRRKDLKKTQITTPRAAYRVVEMGEAITVGDLAKQMAVKSGEIIKRLMEQGVMATINQAIDPDTATLIATEYGFEVKNVSNSVEDILERQTTSAATDLPTEPRWPIVTVMGHVDHGKTSILDAIRKSDVAAGESGGITQHIGAYTVEHNGKGITFLDTPGHEAFSAMRARGAKVTDIVILVVAADDGVMPQTIEAINHAKAAGVPIIVAMNKIDKPQVNLDRIYTELTEHGIQAEEWGGEIQFVKTSAVKRTGIDELLEAVQLQAEVLDLKAPRTGFAEGIVIEAHLDKGRGPVATIVVQKGTLKPGDFIVAGTVSGRVRAMHDYNGKDMASAGPSDPVEILGLSGVPGAGDKVNTVVDEKTAREISGWRDQQARAAAAAKSSASSLEDLLARVKSADVPEVPIIVKGDTQGSVEAIGESILKLSTPKVKTRIVHSAPGGITESDITLAAATGAIIVGFHVRAARGLDDLAEKSGVMIKYFNIIYEIVDAVKAIMVGRLPPLVSELVLGHAQVRKSISVPKIGTIAGSAVIDGKITRSAKCRLIRDNIVIYDGKLGSLRRFKDDVKEVAVGYECGIGIDGYNDIREGDVIEAYVLEETAATL